MTKPILFVFCLIFLTYVQAATVPAFENIALDSHFYQLFAAGTTPQVRADAQPLFIKFFAPWCGHCNALAPVFEATAKFGNPRNDLHGTQFVEVDCTIHASTCQRFGVKRYPTLKLLRVSADRSVVNVYEYSGDRTQDKFIDYAKTSYTHVKPEDVHQYPLPLVANVEQINKYHEELKQLQLKAQTPPPTATPNRSHSTDTLSNGEVVVDDSMVANQDKLIEIQQAYQEAELRKIYQQRELQKELADTASHIVIGESASPDDMAALTEQYAQQQLKKLYESHSNKNKDLDPLLVIPSQVTTPKKTANTDDVPVNNGALLSNPVGPSSQEILKNIKIPAMNFQPTVPVIAPPPLLHGADKFDDAVQKSDRPVFVKFFAPWCGHCKNLAPIWDETSFRMQKEVSQTQLLSVDCTVDQELCSIFGVRGYPTMKLIRRAMPGASSPIEVYNYDGARTVDSFLHYCSFGYKVASSVSYPFPLKVSSLDSQSHHFVVDSNNPGLVLEKKNSLPAWLNELSVFTIICLALAIAVTCIIVLRICGQRKLSSTLSLGLLGDSKEGDKIV